MIRLFSAQSVGHEGSSRCYDLVLCANPGFSHGILLRRVYDVGGQRGQRRKWLQVFDVVTAVIFVLDVASFDLPLREDPTRNRLLEAAELFHQLWNNRCSSRAPLH